MTNATIDVERAPEHIDLSAEQVAGSGHGFTHASFVRWLLGGLALLLLVIGGINWYVDPTGVTGRETRWRIGENAEVRSTKLDLYEARVAAGSEPEVVLLGSSRVMKFDPADVEQLTGASAFNGAVSGGVPRDAWLFVRLVEERQGEQFPHLVWGLDVDAFRDKQLRAGLSTDPRMSRFIPLRERLATMVASTATLTELQTLKATVRSLRRGGADPDAPKAGARRFNAVGFQRWSLAFPRTPAELEQSIRRQIAQYAGFIFERDAYTEIEQEPLDEFIDVVRIANEHGDTPTIFLTPYHPLAEQILARHDIAAREREVRDRLEQLQQEGDVEFELVDLTGLDSFGGRPAEFYDGVHMTPVNTRLALVELDERELLAPTRG